MTEEAKTAKKEIEEIKPSFSWKYLVLTTLLTFIIVSMTALVTYYFKDSPVRELLVANDDSVSLINGDLPTQITARYSLKDKPNKKIKSLFFKKIAVKNNGNEDGENIPLSVFLKGKNIFLVDNPIIKTEPKEIIDIIKVQKEANSTNNEHIWNIPLLKPGETITFEYMIYSEEKIKTPKVNVLVRKKSWKSKKGIFFDSTTQEMKIDFILKMFWAFMVGGIIGGVICAIAVAVSTKRFNEKIKPINQEITKELEELDKTINKTIEKTIDMTIEKTTKKCQNKR